MSTSAVSPDVHSVNAILSLDHQRLDLMFSQVRGHASKGSLPEAAKAFAEFRRGLKWHIDVEEQVLFPILEVALGQGGGPTAVMRSEHQAISFLLDACAQGLERGDAGSFERSALELMGILRAHNAKEEGILYPMADELAQESERAEVARRMAGS